MSVSPAAMMLGGTIVAALGAASAVATAQNAMAVGGILLALSGMVVVVSAVFWRRTAWNQNLYDNGYDKGFREGRRIARPVVIPQRPRALDPDDTEEMRRSSYN